MHKITVIIVDDHEIARNSANVAISSDPRFIVLAVCTNGAEAIEMAGLKNPDVMIMDIKMSPVNGFEATRKISELYPHIKIVAHSIHNKGSYPQNMFKAGAKGFVVKGSDVNELYDAIISVYNNKKYYSKELLENDFLKNEEK